MTIEVHNDNLRVVWFSDYWSSDVWIPLWQNTIYYGQTKNTEIP